MGRPRKQHQSDVYTPPGSDASPRRGPGRPRKPIPIIAPPAEPDPVAPPEPPPPAPPPVAPATEAMPEMYPIEGAKIDATPFGAVTTKWQRWRLVREGKIPAVHVGKRVYLTADAIRDFIRKGGAR